VTFRSIARQVKQGLQAASLVPRGIATYMVGSPPPGEIRVSYGHWRVPRSTELALGGIIKLQHMQHLFPNSPIRFNILYLVSSRLPDCAIGFARMARAKGARVVINQNGVAYPAWFGSGWERINAPMAALVHEVDHVFYQSEFCKQSADLYLGARAQSWEILYNAVDTRMFSPPASSPDSAPLKLLVGGTQDLFYRLETALRVLALVTQERSDVQMLVTGRLCWMPDEAEAARVARRLAAELGIGERVTFLGPYAQKDAPSIFQQAHILLHAKYNDPCPSVVVEAMACGLPVVYSHSGGVPELVGPDAGIGVPSVLSWERELPPDPEAMAKAVLEVAEHRSDFAAAARRRAVEKFDLSFWLKRHREVFEGLLH